MIWEGLQVFKLVCPQPNLLINLVFTEIQKMKKQRQSPTLRLKQLVSYL